MTGAERLVDAARRAGVRLATAESCTGGLLSAAITEVPGASDVFERGFVTYSNAAKIELLGVSEELIARRGAVSEEVAHAMATGALDASHADFALSITGVAGPGSSEHKPEGRVCFGLAGPDGVRAEICDFGALGRAEVRTRSVAHALEVVLAALPDPP